MKSVIRKPKDFLSGILFLLVGAGALFFLTEYKFGSARRMGAAYFPTILAAVLSVFAVILIVRSLIGEQETNVAIPVRPALLILGGAILFALLIRPAGLILAIVPMVLMGATASTSIRPLAAVAIAVTLAVGSTLVFVYALGQPIPVFGYWFQG